MKAYRLARVAEVVREVASETILFEINDPRIQGVTVTRAEVSPDLQHAKVYVSIMGTERQQELCLRALRHAAGFVQSRLARRLQTRFTPVIRFILDKGVKKSIEISRLLHEAKAQTASTEATAPPSASEETDSQADESDLNSPETG